MNSEVKAADAPVNVQSELAHEVMGIYLLIEGVSVLRNLGDLNRACCYVVGLTYSLDLRYPKNL